MKNTNKTSLVISLLAVLVTLAVVLMGCAQVGAKDNVDDTAKQVAAMEAGYQARIAELETALQTQRQEQYINESDFKQKIAALEDRVTQLLGVIEEKKEEDVAAGASVFHYKVRDGGAVITGYEGNATLVTIPAELDGYPVKVIGERAFEGKSIAAVVLPDTIERIEWFAFYQCTELIDMAIPAGVTEIGHAVFDGCTKLTLLCPAGSYALNYAKSYGLSYIIK